MKDTLLKTLSYIALAGTIVPSILVFNEAITLENNKLIMAVSMIVWFATAPLWINKKGKEPTA